MANVLPIETSRYRIGPPLSTASSACLIAPRGMAGTRKLSRTGKSFIHSVSSGQTVTPSRFLGFVLCVQESDGRLSF